MNPIAIASFFLLASLTLFFSPISRASINGDLGDFFNHLGYADNVTNPSAYHGQEAGYYTGGSIFARSQVRDLQIAQIDLPSFRSGCGGIDLFAGGFSFVNADALVSMFKNVLNNAKGYAFTLAMESVTPEIANVMKYVQDLADKVNQANINSCETAEGLVGSLWPKTHGAQRRICEDIGSKQGIFDDYAAAKQGCGSGGQMSDTLDKGSGAYKNMLLREGNLAWKAIQQNDFLSKDYELAELFMSFSGTIIISQDGKGDDAKNQFTLLPSLSGQEGLTKALLHGGETKYYRCDDTSAEKCLHPILTKYTVKAENSLSEQVKKMLSSIVDKIYDDKELSPSEIGLLQATRLPVYKMLNVEAAFAKDRAILDVTSYSDVIATDILAQYLNESLDIVKVSSSQLQYPEDLMSKFEAGIDRAKTAMRELQQSAYSEMAVSTQLVTQTQAIEQMLAGQLSTSLAQNLSWARGMH